MRGLPGALFLRLRRRQMQKRREVSTRSRRILRWMPRDACKYLPSSPTSSDTLNFYKEYNTKHTIRRTNSYRLWYTLKSKKSNIFLINLNKRSLVLVKYLLQLSLADITECYSWIEVYLIYRVLLFFLSHRNDFIVILYLSLRSCNAISLDYFIV